MPPSGRPRQFYAGFSLLASPAKAPHLSLHLLLNTSCHSVHSSPDSRLSHTTLPRTLSAQQDGVNATWILPLSEVRTIQFGLDKLPDQPEQPPFLFAATHHLLSRPDRTDQIPPQS